MSRPLRPVLYDRLVRRFGKVIIADEGHEMHATVTTDPRTRRLRLNVHYAGEYYRVNCPCCGDTRQRLWINHRWGQYVPELQSDNLFLVHCFNENCLKERGQARYLRDFVFSDFFVGHHRDVVLPGVNPANIEQVAAELPKRCRPITEFSDDWPAIAYLRGRGFDPAVLWRDFHVQFCISEVSPSHITHHRLVIPVFFRNELVGWQARSIGDPVGDAPKYYTMPKMRKSHYLYNFDLAARHPFVVVCEGATDVWSFGPEAVAIFGKKISGLQTKLLADNWHTVVVLLDGDATDEALEIYDSLGTCVPRKVIVSLPPDKDPGDFAQAGLRQFVFASALAQGINLGAQLVLS